jgi:hypothetical protein
MDWPEVAKTPDTICFRLRPDYIRPTLVVNPDYTQPDLVRKVSGVMKKALSAHG